MNQNSMKIIVESEELKDELLEQSKYVHDFLEVVKYKNKKGKNKEKWIGLDSDKAGMLMHLYLNPEMIEIEEVEKSDAEIALDFVKNLEVWTTLEDAEADEIKLIIKSKGLTPISHDSSLHVFEERYEIDGYFYVLLSYMGGKPGNVTIQN